jgi:hypothetical protein
MADLVTAMDELGALNALAGSLPLCLRMRSPGASQANSGREFSPEIQPRTRDEHGIVGDQRQTPADRGGSDPEISVMEPLMEGMADQPALVPKLRDRLDGLAIRIEHPDAIGHLLNLP